jgi:hypothetical protein
MKFAVSVICDRNPELEIPQIIDYETVINSTVYLAHLLNSTIQYCHNSL